MSDIEEAMTSDSIELIRMSPSNQSPISSVLTTATDLNNQSTLRRKSDDSGFANRSDDSVNRSDFSSSSDDGSLSDHGCHDSHREVRLVRKCGQVNVGRTDDGIVTSLKRKLFSGDTFTTVVELRWGWHLLLFSSLFVMSWVFFGLVYLLLVTVHEGGECISTVTEGWGFVRINLIVEIILEKH